MAAGALRRATKVCGGALRVFERVRGVCVRVNAHRGAAGMMTHEEKLVRGRAILAAYRAWLRCEAMRGGARRCEALRGAARRCEAM